MKIEIDFKVTKDYYEEFYNEWLNERSKYKKWQPYVGVLIIFFWTGLYFFDKQNILSIVPFLFITGGVYEIFIFFYSKKKWIKERLKNKVTNENISLTFKDEIIEHKGPLSKGDMKWEIINGYKKTSKGLFLLLQDPNSIYIPKKEFNSEEDISIIIQRIELNNN